MPTMRGSLDTLIHIRVVVQHESERAYHHKKAEQEIQCRTFIRKGIPAQQGTQRGQQQYVRAQYPPREKAQECEPTMGTMHKERGTASRKEDEEYEIEQEDRQHERKDAEQYDKGRAQDEIGAGMHRYLSRSNAS